MVDIIEITLTLLIFIVEKCNLHIWKGEKNRVLFVMSIWLYRIFDTIDFRSKNNQSFSFGITTLTVYIDFICLILHMYFFLSIIHHSICHFWVFENIALYKELLTPAGVRGLLIKSGRQRRKPFLVQ